MNTTRPVKPFSLCVVYATAFTQGVAWLLSKPLFYLLFKIEIVGSEKLPYSYGAAIFAANHTSDFDPVLMRDAVPLFSRFAPLITVAKKNKNYEWDGWRKYVYSGILFRALGAFPIVDVSHDYATSLEVFVRAGQRKQSILIFIGGSQKTIRDPIKVKGGTGFLSWATDVPVVPVAIVGTSELTLKKILFTRQKITIEFGSPIRKEELFSHFSEPTHEDFKRASGIIVQKIERMIFKRLA